MPEPPPTRPSLILALRDPDNEHAWNEFVELYTPLVFGHCVRRGLQEADAADVSQEVMKAVAHATRQFQYDRARGSFRAWLLTVTRSKLNNHFAARARQLPDAPPDAEPLVLDAEAAPEERQRWESEYRQRLFDHAAGKVRSEFQPGTWEAFWRTAVLQEPIPQVAASLGISPGAVYIARSRIVARLRALVAEVAGELDLI